MAQILFSKNITCLKEPRITVNSKAKEGKVQLSLEDLIIPKSKHSTGWEHNRDRS